MTRVINIKCEIEDEEDDFMNSNMERFCEIPDGSYIMPDESSSSNILPSVNTLFDIQSQPGETKLDFTILTSPGQDYCDNAPEEASRIQEYYNSQYISNEELKLEFYEEDNEDGLVPVQFLKSEKDNSANELTIGEALECRWEDCWWLFKSQSDLVKHIEQEHVEPKRGDEFPCMWQHCPRRYRPFNARYKLLIHMRVHSGEKPNKCQYAGCMKAFSRLENLKIHQRSHTGERPYTCQYATCSKAFSNSSDRAKHQRTHFDTKPYGCQVTGCNKKYTDPSSLRKHLKNHSGHPVTTKPKKLIASEPKVSAAELQSRCTPVIIYKDEEIAGRLAKMDEESSIEQGQNLEHFNYSPFINFMLSNKTNEGDNKSVDDNADIGGYDSELAECTLDSDTEREFLDLEKLETTNLFPLNEEDLISSFT